MFSIEYSKGGTLKVWTLKDSRFFHFYCFSQWDDANPTIKGKIVVQKCMHSFLFFLFPTKFTIPYLYISSASKVLANSCLRIICFNIKLSTYMMVVCACSGVKQTNIMRNFSHSLIYTTDVELATEKFCVVNRTPATAKAGKLVCIVIYITEHILK